MAVACTCEQCGKGFAVASSEIKKGSGKYCSRTCYHIASRKLIDCVCQQCGTIFKLKPSAIEYGRKYCSRRCKGIAQSATLDKRVQAICQHCGKVFLVKKYKIEKGRGKYCSRRCVWDSTKQQIECTCQYCGTSFTAQPSIIKSGRAKYCSNPCRGGSMSEVRKGNNHPLWKGGHDDYRGPNWKRQRRLAYERDQGICQHCGKKPRKGQRRNAVHHIRPYRGFNGDYLTANQLTNLITLCQHCHPEAEFGKIAVQPYLL